MRSIIHRRALVSRFGLYLLAVGASACGGEAASDATVADFGQAEVFLPTDFRQQFPWDRPVPLELSGVGLLQPGPCTGALIAPNKVLTAYHCTTDNLGNDLPPSKFQFTTHGRQNFLTVARVMHGRSACCGAPADFAILTLSSSVPAEEGILMFVRGQEPNVPTPVSLPGFSQDLPHGNTLGVHFDCGLRKKESDGTGLLYRSDCAVTGGASGAPAYRMEGGVPIVYGVMSGGAKTADGKDIILQREYSDAIGNTIAPSLYFANAPDNAFGITATYGSTGRMHVFATDLDWPLVADRIKTSDDPNSTWTPWSGFDSRALNGRKIAAATLNDQRQDVFMINASGQLLERWESTLGGAWASSWKTLPTPSPIKDIAALGGVVTQLFVLATDGNVYASNKTAGANSPWSSWCNLGFVADAVSLSAIEFRDESGGLVRQLFVASNAGVQTAWTNQYTCSNWNSLRSFGNVPIKEVAAGLLQDGRVHVWGLSIFNVLQDRVRSSTGWTSWSSVSVQSPNSLGFTDLFSARISDGREQLFGISNGEIWTTWELTPNSFAPQWRRFYI